MGRDKLLDITYHSFTVFYLRSHSCKKGRFASSCPSVCLFVRPSGCISEAPTGRNSVKFGIANCYENFCRANPNVVKVGKKYRTVCMKT